MPDTATPANICPQCGAPVAAGAPEGLCPRCVAALNLYADTAITGAADAGPQPAPTPEDIAAHFPQLEVIEFLGRGGMGIVYKARQKALGRLVALKLLAPERVADPEFAERFAHEAKALAALSHPNIVTIHDFGQAGTYFYLLMEFVDGVNLRQAMKAGHFTPEQALAIVPPVCEALQYAHEHGIVHRDIKPENLLLDKEGRVKIADFGIAKILGADAADVGLPESQPAGTPQYMAPEQKEHRITDHRADIYSLGVVLYEMLTGELPAEKLQPPSRRVQVDVRIDEIVLRALEVKPEMRFATAADFRTEVESVVSHPARSEREEARATSSPTGFLKVGMSTLTTAEQLATASGQFYCYRTRGQLILDDRQLTHSRAGMNTIIPLAAIRDLSIGRYPRTMSPAGIDFLSVTYEEGGQRRQLMLSPMEGWIGFPSAFNAHVAEWFTAIREAVIAATGCAPASTPSGKVSTPYSSPLPILAVLAAPLLIGAGLVMILLGANHRPGNFGGGVGMFAVAAFAILFISLLVFGWAISSFYRPKTPVHRASRLLGAALLVGGLVLGGVQLLEASRDHSKRFLLLSAEIPKLQRQWTTAQTEAFEARTALSRFEVNAINARTEAEREANETERQRLASKVAGAVARGDAAQEQIPAASEAINQLRFPSRATVTRLLWSVVPLLVGGLFLMFRRGAGMGGGAEATRSSSFHYAGLLLLLVPVMLLGFVFLRFFATVSSPSGVTRFDFVPVEVTNNVVVVDVTTEGARGNAELRSVLEGPRLPAATEAALQDAFFPAFTGMLIKPTPHEGNQQWRILSPGRQTWRLGFVLPDAALATEAFANLRPIGHLPVVPDRAYAGTLFEVKTPGGDTYRASLQVAPPLTSGDANWVSVSALSSHNESAVTLNWELLASRPGTVVFIRDRQRSTTLLQADPKTRLHRVSVRLELTRIGVDRVLLVTEMGGVKFREEIPGSFRDFSAELLHSATLSAKTVRGASIELCQFEEKSLTVQVDPE